MTNDKFVKQTVYNKIIIIIIIMHKVKPCVEGMGRPEQTQRELKNSRNLASWEREREYFDA